jgi:hypothetical protein
VIDGGYGMVLGQGRSLWPKTYRGSNPTPSTTDEVDEVRK